MLGSVHDTETNGSGGPPDVRRYDAFGGAVVAQGSDTLNLGFAASSSYQTDGDTGLMLLGNRYYDPSTGRFMSQDPAGDGDNWYAYCGNDPLDYVDPEGPARLRSVRQLLPHGRPDARRSRGRGE